MFNHLLLFFGAILLTNLVNANVNLTCYECDSCTSTSTKLSINNRLCLRIQVNCLAANIHIIDLKGDRLYLNHSSFSCGHTLSYSSRCSIAYHCCYTDKCNAYENSFSSSPTSSSSSLTLVRLKRIVINFNILLICHRFFQ